MSILRFLNDRNRAAAQLSGILRYVKRNGAVDEQFLSGQGIMPVTAFEEMIAAKRMLHQEDGKQYLHLVVSCDQVLRQPDIMHQIGVEMAGFYQDYQVMIATHTNTDNLHAHLIINSVNMRTGKKLSQRRADFWKFFRFADGVFQRHNLPSIGAGQLYQVVLEVEDDFWEDDDWDDFDDVVHEELEQLHTRCGIQRPIYFTEKE